MGNSHTKKKEDTACGFCSQKRRVLNISELEEGQHICVPGVAKLTYKEKNRSLKAQYFHHAIIKEIKQRNDYQVTFDLIHYSDVRGFKKGSILIKEDKRDLKYDEIYIVEYRYKKYSFKEIVKRAVHEAREVEKVGEKEEERDEHVDENEMGRILKRFGNYNLFVSNCEHFATWCVLGSKESFQIDQKLRVYLFPLKMSSGVAGVLSQLLLETLRFFASFVTGKDVYGPGFALLVIGAYYLILLLFRYRQIYRYRKNRQSCPYCYEEKKGILGIKLLWFIISGFLFYYITEACRPWFPVWPVTILLHVIFIILSLFFRWTYNSLKSPFRCLPVKVKELSHLKKGTVITFRQFGFKHYALITKLHPDSGEISIISYKGFFFMKLTEYKIHWTEKSIWRLRLTRLTTYKRSQRISRMKRRLGERKWHWRLNRSDHVCYWATIKQKHRKYYPPVHNNGIIHPEEHNNCKQSSLVVETVTANLRNEMEVGDVIKFCTRSKNFKNGTGIITEIKDEKEVENDRRFTLGVVTRTSKSITESMITVDLNTDTIKVKKFHPVHCCSMEERKNRAVMYAKENIQHSNQFNLVEFCVLKGNKTFHEQSDFEKKQN